MTPEERQALITRPFPTRTLCPDYRWGGVQVTDTFLQETEEEMLLRVLNGQSLDAYIGSYRENAESELKQAIGYLDAREHTHIAECLLAMNGGDE